MDGILTSEYVILICVCWTWHSTRVSNELGAGHAEAARLAAWLATFLAVIEVVCASTILFSCRSILGYAFSDEKEVVDYVKEIAPILSLSIMSDCFATMFSGYVSSLYVIWCITPSVLKYKSFDFLTIVKIFRNMCQKIKRPIF